MLPAPIPAHERERLAALWELQLLDTPPETRFDRLVDMAAREFDMPMALISLVDEQRQWFKARTGLTVSQTPRDVSFCGHAILGTDVLLVEDATLDARFADNPLVTAEPHVRFYAGAPLRCPRGFAVGTLCILDTQPRRLDDGQMAALRLLRNLAESELAIGRAEQVLQAVTAAARSDVRG